VYKRLLFLELPHQEEIPSSCHCLFGGRELLVHSKGEARLLLGFLTHQRDLNIQNKKQPRPPKILFMLYDRCMIGNR